MPKPILNSRGNEFTDKFVVEIRGGVVELTDFVIHMTPSKCQFELKSVDGKKSYGFYIIPDKFSINYKKRTTVDCYNKPMLAYDFLPKQSV